MRFGILGPTRVWPTGGQQLTVGGVGLRTLLARLLVDAGELISADRLINDLYGAAPPERAGNALQSQVSRLRRLLRDPGLVEFHPAGYRLAVDPAQVDAHEFERLAGQGRAALRAGDPAAAGRALREGLALWRGPALADVGEAPFAAAEAGRLGQLRLDALEDRAEAELRPGFESEPGMPPGAGPGARPGARPGAGPGAEPGVLAAELVPLLAEHPLRERLRAQLMRALVAAGRPGEALRVFEDGRRLLAEQLGSDPSAELVELHRSILRGTGPPPPPRPGRLPAQLTTFVGREEELARLGEWLDQSRLVTLTGPGGAGKTRLAVEAAARRPGEVCLVELAAVVDGAEVAPAVLSAAGLREAGLRARAGDPVDPVERLVAAFGGWQLLLVLDNCERLVEAVAGLAGRLLAGCPELRVLATSREPLGITGEVRYPLSGLALPPPDQPPEPVQAYPATRLFADRAGEVAPGVSLDPALVGQICRTLDGLPLAIELAAARLGSLPLPAIAARLADRFGLLSGGSRTAQPRHQTLRAVVEWSWQGLREPEQVLARRLTGFTGGATLAAVERVAGGSYDRLANLVDKSLVEFGGGRYSMLETIRAYGLERLVEAGESDWLRRAHAAYYLELAQAADQRLRGAGQLAALSELDIERGNLHAALRHATAAGGYQTALRLVAALSMYWWLRGLRGEAAALAGELQAAIGPQPPPELLTECPEEYALCVLTAGLGGSGPAAPVSRWSAEQVTSRQPRQPFLLYLSGMTSGPPPTLPEEFEQVVGQRLDQLADPWSRALGALGVGLAMLFAGEIAAGEARMAAALAGFRALGERWGTMVTLANLAEHGAGGPAATAALDEALELATELGSSVDIADILRARGELRRQAGDPAGARADFQRVVEAASRAGAIELVAAGRLGLATIALQAGDPAGARELAERALAGCPTGWFVADQTRAELRALLAQLGAPAGRR